MNKPRALNGISMVGPAPIEATEKLTSKKRLLMGRAPIEATEKLTSKKRPLSGFTIMEIMVTLIIVAILTAISLPIYDKTVDEMHKKEAKSVLETLRSAESMYKIDHDQYIGATFGPDSSGDTSRSTLNADVRNNIDWEYSVAGVSGTGINAAATAAARRLRGRRANGYVNLTVTNGTLTEYSW